MPVQEATNVVIGPRVLTNAPDDRDIDLIISQYSFELFPGAGTQMFPEYAQNDARSAGPFDEYGIPVSSRKVLPGHASLPPVYVKVDGNIVLE
ncbi:MAG: hypothetical protein ITG02_01035 [Patulibacter sp.]|nr:hypothetical protein [Patulibacter sp.]